MKNDKQFTLSKYHSPIVHIEPIEPDKDDIFTIYKIVEQNERKLLLKILLIAIIVFLLMFVV